MNAMPALKLKTETVRSLKSPSKNIKKSKDKVIELFRRVEAAAELSEIQKEEYILRYRIKARKLARSILRRWHSRLELNEVDSLVDLSLCEAVRRFNPNRGASFMTFLFYHLRGNLIRAVTAAANSNLVPMFEEESQDLTHDDASEISKSGGYTFVNSMEAADALVGRTALQPEEALLKKEMVDMSLQACSKLDDLEREVILRIYMNGQQLIDIANSLGYSRCHISRVKRKALETLCADLGAEFNIQNFLADEEVSPKRSSSKRKQVRRRAGARKAAREARRLAAIEAA